MSATKDSHQMQHVRQVLLQLRADLNRGASVDLAIGFALVSLRSYRSSIPLNRVSYPDALKHLRLQQAIQVAIAKYDEPAVVAELGAPQAAAMRKSWFDLLIDLTGN